MKLKDTYTVYHDPIPSSEGGFKEGVASFDDLEVDAMLVRRSLLPGTLLLSREGHLFEVAASGRDGAHKKRRIL